MKKVLCFGDSNTYGFNPAIFVRYKKNIRWTGILQKLCGEDFQIIEAGCNNRTAFSDNPNGEMQTGYKILPKFLTSDLDYVILAVGINDLQKFYHTTSEAIKTGLKGLIKITRDVCPNAQIILISPPLLDETILKGNFASHFNKESLEKSKLLNNIYREIALEKDCKLIELEDYVKTSLHDGLHFEPEEHKIIAQLVYKTII